VLYLQRREEEEKAAKHRRDQMFMEQQNDVLSKRNAREQRRLAERDLFHRRSHAALVRMCAYERAHVRVRDEACVCVRGEERWGGLCVCVRARGRERERERESTYIE